MKERKIKLIRGLLLFFMVALFLSGLTAIPIDAELAWLLKTFRETAFFMPGFPGCCPHTIGVKEAHPFLLYGYDWLAFAHFILAILFIGPYRDPVRNIWVIRVRPHCLCAGLPTCFYRGGIAWYSVRVAADRLFFRLLWFCPALALLFKNKTTHSCKNLKQVYGNNHRIHLDKK